MHLASDNFLAWKGKARVTRPVREAEKATTDKASERQGNISNIYTCKEQQKEPEQKSQQSALQGLEVETLTGINSLFHRH